MKMSEIKLCDLCASDVVGGKEAIGWYQGVDARRYNICNICATHVIYNLGIVHYFLKKNEHAD